VPWDDSFFLQAPCYSIAYNAGIAYGKSPASVRFIVREKTMEHIAATTGEDGCMVYTERS
jgi:hypothetical protein